MPRKHKRRVRDHAYDVATTYYPTTPKTVFAAAQHAQPPSPLAAFGLCTECAGNGVHKRSGITSNGARINMQCRTCHTWR